MKNIKTLLLITLALLIAPVLSTAQTAPTLTTLSTAIADSQVNAIVVASATGLTASTASLQTFLIVEGEVMQIRSISGTTITVFRGRGGVATPHASGIFVMFAPAGTFDARTGSTNGVFLGNAKPQGACTTTSQQFLPVVANGRDPYDIALYNCNNGSWVPQTLLDEIGTNITRFCSPNFVGALAVLVASNGSAAFPFDVGTDVTPTAARWQYGSIYVPQTKLLTGISVLNGSVGGTDTLLYALLRADGSKVANSATAGTTASGAARFQDIDFTATYLATGPARYWIAWQSSGATTRLRTVPLTPGATTAGLGAFIGMVGSWFEGTTGTIPTTFASLPSGTAKTSSTIVTSLPTSLITSSAPISCVY